MAAKKPENMSLEESIQELEQLVNIMDDGQQSIEDALKQYERGVALIRASQQKLQQAEQKIKILQQKDDHIEMVECKPEDLE
ncbi:exodeoxyribonuclease VII small subunit [Catenovulum agarivorans]|uniref:exodeoxyribonuclease VII small subunit n=1 Tax=Catenovulum agarivorans TaxID=1172192 RepID=UPI0002FC3BB5|nr:exodeoxyribonuclease VII small subunit [Catenovulum agarivorans]